MAETSADALTGEAEHGRELHVMLVSDNRDNANWGSRSTTMALLELLDRAGLTPAERVMDSEVRSSVPLSKRLAVERLFRRPAIARLAGAGLARGGRTRLVLERMFGIHEAVSDDPRETVRRWRRSGREPMTEWIARVERADALIVNGEGSMIFTTPSRLEQRFHLALMQLAHEARVPFAYINALVADPARGPRNSAALASTQRLLPHAHLVTTRDPWSEEFMRAVAPEVNSTYVPDALFAWHGRLGHQRATLSRPEYLVPFHERPERLGAWDFQQPYICVGGSSEAAKDPVRAVVSYRRLLEALPELGYAVVVTVSSTGDAFLEELAHDLRLPLVPAGTNVMAAAQILAHAEVVVTGRYHPAILAGLGGVPCVLLGADSHKTTSVQEMLGYPEIHVFSEHPSDSDVHSILQRARSVLQERQHWQAAISAAAAARATEARRLPDHLGFLGRAES
ncbi:MAG TPA: polysaccharide pyruvyl transferase family protein [Trueperaceae bacterium]|nr:polysaccharide pyruvyl transferase family protein [Trueperaceae bacterium]